MKKVLAGLLSGVMILSQTLTPALAESENNSADDKMIAQYQIAQDVAAEGIVLLENNGVLPMASSGSVALYGAGAFSTLSNARWEIAIGGKTFTPGIASAFEQAGYQVLTTAESTVQDELSEIPDYVLYVLSRSSAEGTDREYREGDYLLTEDEKAEMSYLAETYGNVILILNVCAVTDFYNDYRSINEKTPDGIGAVVFTGLGGDGGGNAVVDVLNATVPVSGKLADTWALNYEDYPSAETFGSAGHGGSGFSDFSDNEYYSEGIYNGYRYFDTFNVEPAYAFGYGLSYTDFAISDISVEISENMADAYVSAEVTNTGDTWPGKEVVQVYVSYDYNGSDAAYIETAYQELEGYAKTGELYPGESETVEIQLDLTSLSVYDEETDQYLMQAGDYLIRVGDSSDNTQVSAVLSLDETVVIKQCSTDIFTIVDDEEIEGDDAQILEERSLTYADIIFDDLSYKTWDTADVPVIIWDSAKLAEVYEDVSSTYDKDSVVTYISTDETTDSYAYQNRDTENLTGREESYETVYTEEGFTLVDVYEGTITMEQLVASMSVEELADVVTGLSSEQTDDLYDENSELLEYVTTTMSGYQGTQNLMTWRFIPHIFQSDGPEGIGVMLSYEDIWEGDSEETETASYSSIRLPSETVMAQSWNVDLIYQLGDAVGEEMIDAGLSIWLAPGANIHRNPLNGRNYQYYSEDPFLTGTMLTAEVGGVQSHDGVFCCVKHFATNNMETNRGAENNVISERALREIYLAGWEICQTSDNPSGAVMTAYNKINGSFCGESYDLCTALLRGEWNYEGLIMDDYTPFFFVIWRDLVKSVRVGNNLVMPGNTTSDGGSGPLGDDFVNPYDGMEYNGVSAPFQSDSYLMVMAIENGEMLLGELQESAMYILNVYMQTDIFAQIYDAVTTYDIQPSKASLD